MSKRQIIMICGVIVALLPFLGFPEMWFSTILVILGLLIVILAYRMNPISMTDSSTDINSNQSQKIEKPVESPVEDFLSMPVKDNSSISETSNDQNIQQSN